MLAVLILTALFVLLFAAAVFSITQKSKRPSTVPGLKPVTEETGNLDNIAKDGSLHEFLLNLHKQFGPIASFWWGPHYVVSIASAELFKEQIHVSDRPVILYKPYEPLFGRKSLTYVNGEAMKERRYMYDRCFTNDRCKHYFPVCVEMANEICCKWESMLNGEHVPITQYMMDYVLKATLPTLFSEQMKNEQLYEFKRSYNVVWDEMNLISTGPPNEDRLKMFIEERQRLTVIAKHLLKIRKENPPRHGEELFIDLVLDFTDDEELQCDDIITYVVASYHTSGNTLIWAMYYLALHQDCQDNLAAELKDVLGGNDVDHASLSDLKYLKQVYDETLRCAVIGPIAARVLDVDSELGGHKIPKNTPVIHALGVTFKDKTYFPHPDRFDPDRFAPTHTKERPHLAFQPFGFAGKRICPGNRLAFVAIGVALATILQKFKIALVEDQTVTPVHGLVTHPKEEIWITLSRR